MVSSTPPLPPIPIVQFESSATNEINHTSPYASTVEASGTSFSSGRTTQISLAQPVHLANIAENPNSELGLIKLLLRTNPPAARKAILEFVKEKTGHDIPLINTEITNLDIIPGEADGYMSPKELVFNIKIRTGSHNVQSLVRTSDIKIDLNSGSLDFANEDNENLRAIGRNLNAQYQKLIAQNQPQTLMSRTDIETPRFSNNTVHLRRLAALNKR